jgi:hypothetical protein
MFTEQRVTREANLIARQFERLGAEPAAQATAHHINTFWAPLLKSSLLGEARKHADHFSPIAKRAVCILAD